jgi:RecB family exonuclease
VRDDETRLFHVAVSRASELLVVTAVRDEDDQPSPFLDLVDPLPLDGSRRDQARPPTSLPRALALPALVAELRQVVTAADVPEQRRAAAARELARLARAGVRGAHPDQWYGVAPLSDDRPLREPDAPVTVSPSRVEGFDRCALRWLLETAGGTPVDSLGQSVGTLVHALAAAHPAGRAEELRAELARRWPELGLDEGWIADAEATRAGSMVGKLADYLAAAPRELVAVETDFEVTLGRAHVHGRVDRLERDADGRLVVVDLKTGKSKPPKAELARHAQLGVYQLAVEHGGFDPVAPGVRDSGGAALVQLGDGTVKTTPQQQPPLADDEDPGWAAELVARVADGMAAAQFPATDNALCRTCPVRGCCPLHSEGRTVTS